MMAADGGARARDDLAAAKGSHTDQMRELLAALESEHLDTPGLLRPLPTLGGPACPRARLSGVLRCRPRARDRRARPAARLHARYRCATRELRRLQPHPHLQRCRPSRRRRPGRDGRSVCRSGFRSSRTHFTIGLHWPSRRCSKAAAEDCRDARRCMRLRQSCSRRACTSDTAACTHCAAQRCASTRAEVHALMGENGSGKSTLLRILSGQIQPDAGSIQFAGRPTSFRAPTDALRQGIATVTQETTLAPDLSVAENIFLGHRMALRGGLVDWKTTRARARAAIARLGLELDPSLPVRRLRPDRQQMVEIARALSIDARLLILDEPTSSLTDDEVESLFAVVRKLRDDGVSTIFVSHRIDEVFELADRISVLRDGRSVGEAATGELTRGALIHMMVGREARGGDARRGGEGVDDRPLAVLRISARGLSRSGPLRRHRPRRRCRRDRRARRAGGSGKKRAAGDALRTAGRERGNGRDRRRATGAPFATRRYPQSGGLRPRGSQDTGPRAGAKRPRESRHGRDVSGAAAELPAPGS